MPVIRPPDNGMNTDVHAMNNCKGYRSFDDEMKETFGGKVYRLALSAGTTCPNRDGRCGFGGCIFCSAGGSGDFAEPAALPVYEQIEHAKQKVAAKLSRNFAGYMAYFQSFTSTYYKTRAEFEVLTGKFREAAAHPDILALSVATRPDCLPDEMIKVLSEINAEKPVWVELGLQTIHEDTAAYINRGYPLEIFADAHRRLKAAGLRTVVHVIIGLPGEDAGRTEDTVQYLSELVPAPDGIKLQILQVLKGTALAERLPDVSLSNCSQELKNQQIFLKDGMVLPCYNIEDYTRLIVRLVRRLPPSVTVHRLTGDPPKRLLLYPQWTSDKKKVMNAISAAFRQEAGMHC